VYVTAQNHGYCVDAATLPDSSTLWLVNDNDQSVEGFYDAERKVMTVQFHPEAAPGPWEARKLFDVFIDFALEQSLPAAAMEANDASKK
jgi:carbamoyl-phosphate synthase small subunit